MATNVKLGVDISAFKQGIKDAQANVKALGAELERNEAQFRATGDAEQYMTDKARLLKMQMSAQKTEIANLEKALDAMKSKGVAPTSAAYMNMQRQLSNAQTSLLKMGVELNNVATGEQKAATEADKMNGSLKNIGKGVAWENVTDGIGKITKTLENGARAAINFGKKIAQNAMGSAEWADDVLTRAMQNGVDAETIQRMDNVAAFIDTDTDVILNARDRLEKGLGKGTTSTLDALAFLGITDLSDPGKVFWEAGEALMALTDSTEQEAKANDLFGKSWKELVPLFTAGEEEYNRLMDAQKVLTNEQVQSLGDVDDAYQKLMQQIELAKNQFWADNAETITGFMQWIVDNSEAVKAGLIAIGTGFGALKVAETAANIAKVVDGFKQLGWIGGGGASGGGGTVWGSIAGKLAGAGGAGAGGLAMYGISAALLAEWKAGWALIEANLKDASLNQVYGDNGGEGGIIDNLDDGMAALVANYFRQWANAPGTEGAFDARDALQQALEASGVSLSEQAVSLIENIFTNFMNGSDPDGLVAKLQETHPEIFVDPVPAEDAAEQIAAQVGTVQVPAELVFGDIPVQEGGGGGGHGFANGLPMVPWDGYPAILHKGERVVPARAMSNTRNYNSNLYVENMVMNNGQDADGLALRVAAAQRQMNRGYGS